MTAEELAQRFHETYERLAPAFGYETRRESAKPWADVPEQNRQLMTAVCAEIQAVSSDKLAAVREIIQEWLDKQDHERCWYYPELFGRLSLCLELKPTVIPSLPPRPEFEEGCHRYQAEQYAERKEVATV